MDTTAREAFLNYLEEFIASADKNVQGVLQTLGWSPDHVLHKHNDAICPLDPGHKMPQESLSRHVETCSWIQDGHSKEEKERLPPSSDFAYEQSTGVVKVSIDEIIQESILHSVGEHGYILDAAGSSEPRSRRGVPKTGDRASADFSRQERLAIYDFVVAQGKTVLKDKVSRISLEDMHLSFDKHDEPQKPKSKVELLAEERDYKRRRQSYRAKNVHITKKSYTEVIREVIQKQMEYLNPETGRNSPTISDDTEQPSGVGEDGCDDRRIKDDGRNSRRRERSRSLSSERRRSHYSPQKKPKKNRSRSPKSSRRDHFANSDESSRRSSRSHTKHKHRHHRSRRRSSSRS